MGGGFGAKQIAWKHDVIAALLSRQAGRPVQLMLDREAENLAVGNRNPTRQRVRLGARRDGTLTAIDADIEQAAGAYRAGGEASDVSGMYQTLYRCPNVRTEQTAVYTNTGRRSPSAAPATSKGRSRSSRRWTSWRARSTWTRSSCGGATTPSAIRSKTSRYACRRGCASATTGRPRRSAGTSGRGQPAAGPKRRGIGFAAHDWVAAPATAGLRLGQAQRRRLGRRRHRHAGYRHRHPHRAGPGRRRRARACRSIASRFSSATPRPGRTRRSAPAARPRRRIGPAIRAAATDAKRQLLDVAATLLEVDAARLTLRDGHDRGRRRSAAARWPSPR